MESMFLMFFVGIFIFVISFLTRKLTERIHFLIFLGSGSLAGAVAGIATGYSLVPGMNVPWFITAAVGCFAGIILFAAEKLKIFTRPGFQYFATILLGLIIAGIFYGLMILYITAARIDYNLTGTGLLVPLVYILSGFLIVFGYSFPVRWFRQQKTQDNSVQ